MSLESLQHETEIRFERTRQLGIGFYGVINAIDGEITFN